MSESHHDLLTRVLLAGGVLGPLLFIAVFLLEGATRPGYSAWRNYVSELSLSDQGWQQIANFLVCGILCLGLAIGLRRAWPTGKASTWGPLLVGLFGLGLVIAGVFVTDPARGYPPGTPLNGGPQSWHGTVHGINALVVFPALVAACFVMARRFTADPGEKAWARYSKATGIAVIVLFVLSTASGPVAEHGLLPSPTGLLQRAEIILGWVWLALVALHELRKAQRSAALSG